MHIIKKSSYLVWGSAILLASPAMARDAGVLAAVEGFGGVVQDDARGDDTTESLGILPSLNFDLGGVVVQADAIAAEHRKDTHLGGAVHAGGFLTDTIYVGGYGSYVDHGKLNGLNTVRAGGEVVLKTGIVTVSGVAGYEDSKRGTEFVRTMATHDVYNLYGTGEAFFSMANLDIAAGDKAHITLGHRYVGKRHAGVAEFSYDFAPGGTMFAAGRLGEGDYNGGWVGIRVTFGGADKNRMRDTWLKDDLFMPGNTRRQLLVPLPPPPPPPGGNGSCGGSCGGYSA